MKFTLGILTGLTTATLITALTHTRTYRAWVRWVWLADVRRSDPHLYGRHAR
jgi:hypothetical protein